MLNARSVRIKKYIQVSKYDSCIDEHVKGKCKQVIVLLLTIRGSFSWYHAVTGQNPSNDGLQSGVCRKSIAVPPTPEDFGSTAAEQAELGRCVAILFHTTSLQLCH